MKFFIKIFLIITALLLNFACSDLNNDITQSGPIVVVHGEGILDSQSPEFHGNLIRSLNWRLSACWECHASDYSGGITGVSCLNCHTETGGPEACNTCHGDPTDIDKIAPPKDLAGNTSTTNLGVGAHTSHLYENLIGTAVNCEACHVVPANLTAPGHIGNDNRAEITFGDIALVNMGTNSSYSYSSGDCSNTYCHGNFILYKDSSMYPYAYTGDMIVGNNKTVNWTAGESQIECGSCHGLPPTGHTNYGGLNTCGLCHSGIVDANGNIVDSLKYKHVNGVVNLYEF